jgi:alpha-glucosidase
MGDELGMVDTPIPAAELRDPAALRQPGLGRGRDPQRTPFPWEDGPGAGFTTGTPWLRIGADMPQASQRADPGSMLSCYRQLISLRRAHPALVAGAIRHVEQHGAVLAYQRVLGERRFWIVPNISDRPADIDGRPATVLASTHGDRIGPLCEPRLSLRPNEGLLLRMAAGS